MIEPSVSDFRLVYYLNMNWELDKIWRKIIYSNAANPFTQYETTKSTSRQHGKNSTNVLRDLGMLVPHNSKEKTRSVIVTPGRQQTSYSGTELLKEEVHLIVYKAVATEKSKFFKH